jgi:hypothetical protein
MFNCQCSLRVIKEIIFSVAIFKVTNRILAISKVTNPTPVGKADREKPGSANRFAQLTKHKLHIVKKVQYPSKHFRKTRNSDVVVPQANMHFQIAARKLHLKC